MYPNGQPSADQSRSKVGADHPCYRDEVAQQNFIAAIARLLQIDNIWPGWAKPQPP